MAWKTVERQHHKKITVSNISKMFQNMQQYR